MTITVIGALVAGLAGAVSTFLIAARKFGGQIKTSTAEALWAEANSLRAEYKETADALRGEITACRERISALEHDNDRLHDENHQLQRRIEELTRENERLRMQLNEMQQGGRKRDA